MNAKAVDFILYTVSDLEASVTFYRETLGLELEHINEDVGWAEFTCLPTTLALDEADKPLSPGEGGGGVGVALAIDDVEAAVDEFHDEGMSVLMEPHDTGVCDMAVVGDPDENPIILHRRHDDSYGRQDSLP